jgi:hypothetical protein
MRPVKRLALLLPVVVATVTSTAAAGRAAPAQTPLQIGAVVPELLVRSLVGSTVEAMTNSGLDDAGRITLTWKRGQKDLDPGMLSDLQYAVQQAAASGIDIYLALYPAGPTDTPRTVAARTTFARWAAWLAARLPEVRHIIIGNEPNLNRFWLPQFGRGGKDVAAPAYVRLLARAYDAIKAVGPSVEIVGGALAHAGVNRPSTVRDTQAPQRFLLDMGKAYRESGRKRPIMDAFAFHPYLEHANLPPTYKHYSPRIMTIADYGRLVSLLRRAFDGTGQAGSKIPIVYAEFGVESRIPAALAAVYTGTEPATTRPVTEAVQAKYYAKAMQMAACQPTVRIFFVFRLIDEPIRGGWQSGVYYANGSPKASLPGVEATARRLQEQAPTGCATLLAPKPHVWFFPVRRPTAGSPVVRPISLLADADCVYQVQLTKGSSLVARVRGRAVAGVRKRIGLTEKLLPRGTYRITVRVAATDYKANAFTTSRTFAF